MFKRLLYVLFLVQSVYAGTVGGDMVWDSPMQRIAHSLTTTTAGNVGLIALFAAVATLVWDHDIGRFGKMVTWAALGISVLLLGGQFLTGVFGGAGAVI